MTFSELTRVMLSSMDFFELRRTAARYGVPYQGIRRSKLLRDLERKITVKHAELGPQTAQTKISATIGEASASRTAKNNSSATT